MALTLQQIKSLGFKPSKRGNGLSKTRKYDTLVYPLNSTDFLYIGYSPFRKEINNKIIWKSFKQSSGMRITYPIITIGDTSFSELKDFLQRANVREYEIKMRELYSQDQNIEDSEETLDVLPPISELPESKYSLEESLNILAKDNQIDSKEIPSEGIEDSWSKDKGVNINNTYFGKGSKDSGREI